MMLWGLPVLVDDRVPQEPPWNGVLLVPAGVDPEPYLQELDRDEEAEA